MFVNILADLTVKLRRPPPLKHSLGMKAAASLCRPPSRRSALQAANLPGLTPPPRASPPPTLQSEG